MLKLCRERSAFDFLQNECWEVDGLVQAIRKNDLEDAFDILMDDLFPNVTDFIKFQDYCRFNEDEIKHFLGINDDGED